MNKLPLISIIIRTYNRDYIVKSAIESALSQTYPNKQIIVVDDGSDDTTKALVSAYENVEYIYQKNSGQANARRTGVSHARGSFIATLDSDDIWGPDFLFHCMECLLKHNFDFVFTNWYQQTKKGEWVDGFAHHSLLNPHITDQSNNTWEQLSPAELRKLYLECCPSPSSSFVVRRSSMLEGIYDNMNVADDWCVLLDMIMTKNCRVAFTSKKLWRKQVGKDNIYDGRSRFDITRILSVEDRNAIIFRYTNYLTNAELRFLRNLYMQSLLALAIYALILEVKLRKSYRLISMAFYIDKAGIPFAALKICWRALKILLRKNPKIEEHIRFETVANTTLPEFTHYPNLAPTLAVEGYQLQ